MNHDAGQVPTIKSHEGELTCHIDSEPAPASIRDGCEATELFAVTHTPEQSRDQRFDEPSIVHIQGPSSRPQLQGYRRWLHGIQSFWKHYIHLAVPHASSRDHLANERTFLAYQRTSLALSMLGIVTAQLFNLQRSTSTHPSLGYFALGKPLAALFQITAMMITIIGAHRFWRQQMNMSRGKVWAGGWEIYAIMAAMLLLVTLVFVLLIAVNITEEM